MRGFRRGQARAGGKGQALRSIWAGNSADGIIPDTLRRSGDEQAGSEQPWVALPLRGPGLALQGTRLMQPRKLLARVSRGDVQNVVFGDFCRLLEHVGFASVRTAGSAIGSTRTR